VRWGYVRCGSSDGATLCCKAAVSLENESEGGKKRRREGGRERERDREIERVCVCVAGKMNEASY